MNHQPTTSSPHLLVFLAVRAPIKVPPRHLLAHHLRTAHKARLPMPPVHIVRLFLQHIACTLTSKHFACHPALRSRTILRQRSNNASINHPPPRITSTASFRFSRNFCSGTSFPATKGLSRARYNNSARKIFPTPAATDWSINKAAIGFLLFPIFSIIRSGPSLFSGSGPSRFSNVSHIVCV